MSAFDSVYILLFGFLLVLFAILGAIMWVAVAPQLQPYTPAASFNAIDSAVDSMLGFWNLDFSAIIILMLVGSVVLALFAYSHPAMLLAWFLFNLVTVLVYWLLNNILTQFIAALGSLNPGTMAAALSFFGGPLPYVILVFNILMAIVLMGKKFQAQGGLG